MEFFISEDIKPLSKPWNIKEKHLFLGSCFANDIGVLLEKNGVNAIVNPTGTLFHPQSVLKNIEWALDPSKINEDHFVQQENVLFSLDFHASNYGSNLSDFMGNITPKLRTLKNGLKEAKYIVLTLGTAFHFLFKEDGESIVNCQKQPGHLFAKKRSTVAEIVENIKAILELIGQFNSDFEVLLTVSPVRHKKEGLHENNLSKATLLLAIDQLVDDEKIHYFPAYELVIDTLRDYRFFESDRVHTTPEAQQFVYEKMIDFAYPTDRCLLEIVAAINKKIDHKSIHSNKPSAIAFKENLSKEIDAVQKELPHWKSTLHPNNV